MEVIWPQSALMIMSHVHGTWQSGQVVLRRTTSHRKQTVFWTSFQIAVGAPCSDVTITHGRCIKHLRVPMCEANNDQRRTAIHSPRSVQIYPIISYVHYVPMDTTQ